MCVICYISGNHTKENNIFCYYSHRPIGQYHWFNHLCHYLSSYLIYFTLWYICILLTFYILNVYYFNDCSALLHISYYSSSLVYSKCIVSWLIKLLSSSPVTQDNGCVRCTIENNGAWTFYN